MQVEDKAAPVRMSRKRSNACTDEELEVDQGPTSREREDAIMDSTLPSSSQPKELSSDQVSSCSTVPPSVISPGAGASSPDETSPASNTPEQVSDSCGSHPSNSPVNMPSTAEASEKPSSFDADAGAGASASGACKQNPASSDVGKIASILRFAKGSEHSNLIPPLLPSPASPAPPSSGVPDAEAAATGAATVCTKETQDKDRVGGLDWSERRRKNMMDKAYQGFEGMPRAQQVARLKQTVERLQSALPGEAKTKLLSQIRRYLVGEATPEALAEAIKELVDEHNVVVPLQEMPAAPSPRDVEPTQPRSKSSGKREAAGGTDGGPCGKKQREAARGAGRKNERRKNGKSGGSGAEVKAEEAEDTSAWEALLSVCTMGMK